MNLPFKVGISPNFKGIRGLIATKDIKAKSLIESCPVVIFPIEQDKYIEKTIIRRYYFEWDDNQSCIVLGYCMLMNHAFQPNCQYINDFKNKVMNIIALTDIKKGSELLINYDESINPDKLDPEYLDGKF